MRTRPPPLQVWVKVTGVQGEGRDARVSCSMKVVSQEGGQDLDPGAPPRARSPRALPLTFAELAAASVSTAP